MVRYEALEHTADTGVVVEGEDLAELFENAAYGLFDLTFDVEGLESEGEETVEVEGDGLEELMVAWLEELLFLLEARDLATLQAQVDELDERTLRATVRTVPAGALELTGPPVKAITYHDLKVEQTPEGWRARIIFDV